MPGTITRWRRYSEIATVLARHGLAELAAEAGLGRFVRRARVPPELWDRRRGERLRLALEALGPVFIKFGQFLSTRPDLLPEETLAELAALQDEVPPFPFPQAVAVVEQELGRPLAELFCSFGPEPAASASLGQVYHARLPAGDEVAVKVQRPGIREQVETDLAILHRTARFLQEHSKLSRTVDFLGIADEFDRSLHDELDYLQEERNTTTIGRNLAGFERVRVPRVYPEYTCRRVLTLERIFGHKITQLPPGLDAEQLRPLAREFIKAYLKQVAVDGIFHADPHPGNVWLDNEGCLVLMDFGMVARLDESEQERFIRLLLAFVDGNGDQVAATLLEMSPAEEVETANFKRDIGALVARYQTAALAEAQLGRAVLEMTRAATANGVRLPSNTIMLGKALLNADAVARVLDPELRPVEVVQGYLTEFALSRTRALFSRTQLLRVAVELVTMLEDLPSRVNALITRLSENEFRFTVQVDRVAEVLVHMRKIANRITFGVINGSIIIGAALLAQVRAGPTIAGYPALATIGFLVAALMGFYMLVDILLTDRPPRGRR